MRWLSRGELEETGRDEGRRAFEQGREPIRMSNRVHDEAARREFDRLRGESMRPGEPVEVLKYLVSETGDWLGGYRFVRSELESGCFIVAEVSGEFAGVEVRHEARRVRRPLAAKE